MRFNERLKHLREKNGLTLEELGNQIGVGKSAIGNYETGYRYPKKEHLEALADIFNVDLDYLTGRSEIPNKYQQSLMDSNNQMRKNTYSGNSMIEMFHALDEHGKQMVSYVLQAEYDRVQQVLSASRGEVVENSTTIAVPLLRDARSQKVIGTVPVAATERITKREEDLFALKVTTDSMSPRIIPGDTVIVRKQNDVDSGDIAVVLLDGVQVVCKQVIKDGDALRLVPLNHKYPERVYKKEDVKKRFEILGRVVENIQAV